MASMDKKPVAQQYIEDLEYVEEPLTSKSPSIQLLGICYRALVKIQSSSHDHHEAINQALKALDACDAALSERWHARD